MIIPVKVITRAKKERIEKNNDCIKVYLSTPPIKGKANKRLIEVLCKYFNVKKQKIKIIKGLTSHNKLIEIDEFNRK